MCGGRATSHGAFHQDASYLFYETEREGVDAILPRRSSARRPQLGVKLFMTSRGAASAAWATTWPRCTTRTRSFHAQIAARPGFECPYEPESNIVCFRYGGRPADRQVAIRERLIAEGEFHLSSTVVSPASVTCGSWSRAPTTDEAAIERLLNAIEKAV